MTDRDQWTRRLLQHGVPAHLHDGLIAYVDDHRPPGDTLLAILRNDLRQTMAHADPVTVDALPAIVSFLTWDTPADCWGSPDIVRGWLCWAR